MENTDQKIIARFPPSPTGWFHIGNARTAIFNYIFVKRNNGLLRFRLEDTDKERSKDEYAQDIVSGLKWLGLDIDYDKPYKQSEHGETYKKYIETMIRNGTAYFSKEEVKEEGQRAEVIRLKNQNKKIKYVDMVRGEIEVDTTELGDFVIAKSITEPIYHLAVVVDDFEMGVTHVIRGEDGIYNTPRQILIQEAIGAPRPIYAHMPFILNEDRSKLSKRKQGELVSLSYYRKQGYLPEAIVNYLSLCGWNPGTEQEILSMDELVEKFDITKVQKSGAIFNRIKLNWFNKEYIKKLPAGERNRLILERLDKVWPEVSLEIKNNLLTILGDRISYFAEVETIIQSGEFDFLLKSPDYSTKKLIWKGETAQNTLGYLKAVHSLLESMTENDFTESTTKTVIWPLTEKSGRGNVLWPLRYALSGMDRSPDPFILLKMLGREETLKRLTLAEKRLSSL